MGLWLYNDSPLLGIWKIEEPWEALLDKLEHKEWYLPSLQQFVSDKRKQEWLSARILLKELTGKELRIDYRPNGAPFLPGHPMQISISHTKGYAAVILSGQGSVAIDIEQYASRVLKLHQRFLSMKEYESLSPVQPTHSLLYWSAKETLFKLIGQQEVDFKKHLFIHPFQCVQNEGTLHAIEYKTSERKSYLIHYLVAPDFVMTYATT